MATVDVRFWAGARRAAGHESERLEVATIGELRRVLSARPELQAVCAVASFLVNGQQATDTSALADGALVDVLPPFAGGADAVGLHAWVSGDVQGVGFRAWTYGVARRLGVVGWVTNLPDGRVEVAASGARAACQRLLDALRGPDAPGAVDAVDAEWGAPQPTDRFDIR